MTRPKRRKSPSRTPGRKANYQGATPKQVARALYWHRRRKPACHSDRVAEDGTRVKTSI